MICHWEEGRGKKEEGSSATDYVTDVTDVRKKEEGRRNREEGRKISLGRVLCTKPAQCSVPTAHTTRLIILNSKH
ncbi:hypothetical protein QUA35_11430 [Microcoleus sp. N9_B2]|uniref:hypothetical protein n=1 Tax=unclassified Microcoleus TaxID=2642155 RepID=UPI002FD05233